MQSLLQHLPDVFDGRTLPWTACVPVPCLALDSLCASTQTYLLSENSCHVYPDAQQWGAGQCLCRLCNACLLAGLYQGARVSKHVQVAAAR